MGTEIKSHPIPSNILDNIDNSQNKVFFSIHKNSLINRVTALTLWAYGSDNLRILLMNEN